MESFWTLSGEKAETRWSPPESDLVATEESNFLIVLTHPEVVESSWGVLVWVAGLAGLVAVELDLMRSFRILGDVKVLGCYCVQVGSNGGLEGEERNFRVQQLHLYISRYTQYYLRTASIVRARCVLAQ